MAKCAQLLVAPCGHRGGCFLAALNSLCRVNVHAAFAHPAARHPLHAVWWQGPLHQALVRQSACLQSSLVRPFCSSDEQPSLLTRFSTVDSICIAVLRSLQLLMPLLVVQVCCGTHPSKPADLLAVGAG